MINVLRDLLIIDTTILTKICKGGYLTSWTRAGGEHRSSILKLSVTSPASVATSLDAVTTASGASGSDKRLLVDAAMVEHCTASSSCVSRHTHHHIPHMQMKVKKKVKVMVTVRDT